MTPFTAIIAMRPLFWYNFFMEKLSSSKDAAGYKLLILYVLKKINMPVGSLDLVNYILEERLMGYLMFQQRINELIEAKHITVVSGGGKKVYSIADEGLGLLTEMSDLIPRTEKNRVDRTAGKLNRRAINKRSVVADYTPDDENNCVARIGLNEGDLQILNMEIATASKEDARAICRNWKERAVEIYAGIIGLFLDSPQNEGDAIKIGGGDPPRDDDGDGEKQQTGSDGGEQTRGGDGGGKMPRGGDGGGESPRRKAVE